MKGNVLAWLAGALFGVGLVVSGMTDPAKVQGFLDFFGAWDPSLAFVMGGAVTLHLVLLRLVTRRAAPLFDTRFHLPTRTDVNQKLVVGAVVFGVGWGLAGYCPGPGLVSLGTGGATAMIFVGAMTIGMVLQHQVAHMHTEPGGGLTTVVGKS
ncbi:MAG: YeeE/YedE family protein [Myxococcales bacterium]|nr:YeeE/YedE family protein [Myxococcales bacterium]MCB9732565.1 YeeE/YedE family protein [Deltaproteobacteria bacterium]